jgi:hypothetical protein
MTVEHVRALHSPRTTWRYRWIKGPGRDYALKENETFGPTQPSFMGGRNGVSTRIDSSVQICSYCSDLNYDAEGLEDKPEEYDYPCRTIRELEKEDQHV